MDKEIKGSKKIMTVVVSVLAAITLLFRGYLYFRRGFDYYQFFYVGIELFFAYLVDFLCIICPIIVIIAVVKENRKIALSALAIQYATVTILGMIGMYFRDQDLLPILCEIIITVILFMCAFKKINAIIAVVVCSIAQVYNIMLFIKELWFIDDWRNGYFHIHIDMLVPLFFYFVYLLAESALVICLICMFMKLKISTTTNNNNGFTEAGAPYFEQRDIALCVILSIVTFGVYGVVWLVGIVRDVHKLHGNEDSVTTEVLLILFVPFYVWYWMYTRGKQMFEDSRRKGGNLSDNSAIYLILSIFGLIIVDYALIQNEFNKYATSNMISPPNHINYQTHAEAPSDITSKLTELRGLLNSGFITEEEYESKRKEILDRM